MEKIIDYYVKEKNTSRAVAIVLAKRIGKYDDIKEAFVQWLYERDYEMIDICVEGLTAKDIHDMAPFLDASGVFDFMLTLRDQPGKAKQYIEQGFPRK